MDLGIALALGFLGSLHCAAMCGPLMLALPVGAGGSARFVEQRVVHHIGRIVIYCLLGIMAGFIGKSLFLIGMQRWFSISLGLAILTGLFASKQISILAPIAWFVVRLKTMMSAQLQQRSFGSLLLLGMLNGLLPCGLVYVALAGAATQGTVLNGVGYMATFGLGTLPMMLGISLSRQLLPLPLRQKMRRAIPIGICLIAGLLILRGMALGIPYVSPILGSGVSSCCGAR